MGNFVGFTDTQFVGTEELGAVSSYQPCHVFGDSMLIGKGIRVGFYLLYIAAIIAVLFGVDQQFRIWNASWALIALSTFVSLVLNSTPQTLVVLDWAVLIQLVLFFPVFFFFQVFHKALYTVADKQHDDSLEIIRQRVVLRRAVTELDASRARAYADVLKAFALHAAEIQIEGDYEASQARLRRAIEIFSLRWSEHGAVGGSGRTMQEMCAEGELTAVVYHPELLTDVIEAPTRRDVEAFKDHYIAALVNAELSVQEARDLEAEVAALAAEELQIKRRAMKPKHAAKYMLWGTAVKDKIAAALALLIWSAWMFATPNVWTRWKDYGRKPACDGYVKLYFVFQGYDPWQDSFGKFLIIFACGAIPVALCTTLIAAWLLVVGLFGRRGRSVKAGSRRRRQKRTDEEASHVKHAHTSPKQSRYAQRRHADDVLTCIHSREIRSRRYRYRRNPARPLHFNLFSIPWAVVLAVLLVYTIATVEVMLVRDRVDFVRPDLHETAEILVFLVGLLILVLVLWSLIEGLIRLLTNKRQRTSTHHTQHHHGVEREGKRIEKESSREELWVKKGDPSRQAA